MHWERNGFNAGMVATRRNVQLTSFREPLRYNLWNALIDYWPLCEPNSTRLGAVLGKKAVPTGAIGNAGGLGMLSAAFAGSGQPFLQITSDADVQLGNVDWTISAWAMFTATGVNHMIVTKDDASTLREHSALRIGTVQNELSSIYNGVSTSLGGVTTVATFTINTWYHMTALFDHTAAVMSIVMNGTKLAGSALSGGTPAASTTPMGIGGDNRAGSTVTMSGQAARVGLWKRILTDDEIAYLYNGGRGRDFPWI